MVRPDRCDMNSVWATTLTVGRMTGGTYTFYGYSANSDTYFGGTGVADFHYNWRDHTVKALYYQEDNYEEDYYEETPVLKSSWSSTLAHSYLTGSPYGLMEMSF